MDNCKIINFLKSHTNQKFPECIALGIDQCLKIEKEFKCKFRIGSTSNLELVKRISDEQKCISDLNALDNNFDIKDVFEKLNILSQEKIYINWFRFEKIDIMLLSDFCIYFSDIWYPAVDDIDIFDDALDWILSIDHEGYVKYCNIGQKL